MGGLWWFCGGFVAVSSGCLVVSGGGSHDWWVG